MVITVPRAFGGTLFIVVGPSIASIPVIAIARDGKITGSGKDGKLSGMGRDGKLSGRGTQGG